MKNRLTVGISVLLLVVSAEMLDLRCYCNLPACLHSAYMCRSTIGCFQELLIESLSLPNNNGRIGCLELWPSDESYHCLRLSPWITNRKKKRSNRRFVERNASLRCCREDMCNYVQHSKGQISGRKIDHDSAESTRISHYSTWSRSSWFQITVISVPILGSIILLFLIIFTRTLLNTSEEFALKNDQLRLLAVDNKCGKIGPKQTILFFNENAPKIVTIPMDSTE